MGYFSGVDAMTLPVPRTPDPRVAPPLRWGILAPGMIAARFAEALHAHTRQVLVGVASRSRERASAFAQRHGVARVHDSYEALVTDPGIDAVYVASPHSEHRAQALLAIGAGKHVLVEKAFARNAVEARALVEAARTQGVTLMEAMKTRFLPRTDVVRQLLADGALGELVYVRADQGAPLGNVHRLLDPALAGGGLLDLGVYAVSYVLFALGSPRLVRASGFLTDTGVDRQACLDLEGFPDHPHAQAQLFSTLAAATPRSADIIGSLGRLELPGFHGPGPVRWSAAGLEAPPDGLAGTSDMAHEIAHFAQLVADQRQESPLMSWADTITTLEILDEARRQFGVRYPGE